MSEKVREVKPGGPRGRAMGPRPKIKNPGRIIKRLMGMIMEHYSINMFLVFVCTIVAALVNVRGNLFLKTLIDDHIIPMTNVAVNGGTPDFGPLIRAILVMALIYAAGVVASFLNQFLMTFVGQGTMRNIRKMMFEHMQSLPISYFDTHSHGDVMSLYTNDVDTLRQTIGMSMPQLLNSLISITATFVSMLVLDVPLTIISCCMIAITMFLSARIAKVSTKYYVSQQSDLGDLNGYIEEHLSGQKVVKVFCREDECISEFRERNDRLRDSANKANRYANMFGPVSMQMGNVSYAVVAVIGAVLAINGFTGLTVGTLVSFLTLNKSFNMPISQVSSQFNSIIMSLAGADRIFRLLDEKPETDEGYVTLVNCREGSEGECIECKERTGHWAWKHPHQADGTVTYVPLAGKVTLDDVDFGYTDDKMVLHNIKMFAEPGQKIAFVGSTGAGKTTITNLINRFYDIQDGKIRYDDININKIKKADLRRSLGMVLQDTHLFKGTVMENIRFGNLDATDEECRNAAKLANADGFIKRLPEGYDTMLTGDGGNLSQGQRQLLAIARAAVADPPVLILDEATSSIDTHTERLVQEGMDRLMSGRTTFVIAHRLSTVKNSDCIMVLENGRIVERGTHDDLIEEKGRYYQLYTGNSIAS
ncbi:MAG: ABC transporter ATP-binding protein/permease [Lachnospiraceae bacterium]|nr:ABC transporter ATP-binding protein/permease [Lachnospiraceae bacterium]